jgi:hypothetical protein
MKPFLYNLSLFLVNQSLSALLPPCDYTSMKHRFHTPNESSQKKSKRIKEETWETYKPDILREFRTGGGQGNAQALRWIGHQNISGFHPKSVWPLLLDLPIEVDEEDWLIVCSSRQLRHRISVVWGEGKSPSASMPQVEEFGSPGGARTHGILDAPKDEHDREITIHPGAELRSSSQSEKSDLEPIPKAFEDSRHGETHKGSPFCSPQSMLSSSHPNAKRDYQNQDSSTQGPRKRQRSEAFTHDGLESTKVAFTSTSCMSRVSQERFSINDHMPQEQFYSKHDDQISKRAYSVSPQNDKSLCVHCDKNDRISDPENARNNSPVPTTPSSNQLGTENSLIDRLPLINEGTTSQFSQGAFEEKPEIYKVAAITGPSSPTHPTDPLQNTITDPVMEPRQLQRLLATIDIDWPLDIATQWLRKDVVFLLSGKQSTPPTKYSEAEIAKIETFGEVQYASSNLDDAFLLFLQAWVAQRKILGYPRAETFLRLARSAKGNADTLLVMAILEDVVPELSQSDCFRWALVYPEISSILQEGRMPFPIHIAAAFCRRYTDVLIDTPRDSLGSDIAEQPFGCASDIRQCLQRAADIFKDEQWLKKSRKLWKKRVQRTWPSSPTYAELASFFCTLYNWPTFAIPTTGGRLHSDNLSELDIISVISHLIVIRRDGRDPLFTKFETHFGIPSFSPPILGQSVNERLTALLVVGDGPLLSGFRSCFLKVQRAIFHERVKSPTMTDGCKKLIADVFAKRDHLGAINLKLPRQPHPQKPSWPLLLRPGMTMSVVSLNPTLAASYSTSSDTWSNMRRQSTVTLTPSTNRWSRSSMAISIAEISDRASLLTLSNEDSIPPVLESNLFGLDEGDPNTLANSLVLPSTKPPVPKFWGPTGSNRKKGGPKISFPTQVVHSTNTLVPTGKINQL